jgi:hypothetical protein
MDSISKKKVPKEYLMDIYLATEKAFHLIPQIALEVARDRLEQKKTNLVAGTVGALLSRPKPEEIQMISVENRLEPFWLVSALVHTAFDRNCSYTIPVSGTEVHTVSTLGQDLPVTSNPKGGASFTINGLEHCIEERRASFYFDGAGAKVDMSKYANCAKSEIADWATFAPEGTLVVTPQARATTVVRTVLAEMIKPVQAQIIHEEWVNLEAVELNFRPVYALEYEWAGKGKRVVLEFDAITGDVRTGGRKLSDQIKNMVTRDLIFDVTADAVGMLVPGGSIAVKLVKAAVDHK